MRKIRSDIGDIMPKNIKYRENKGGDVSNGTSENNDNSDQVKKINDRLKEIYLSVENDPKFEELKEGLQYLIDTNLHLLEGTIKVDSNLIETYNHVIVYIEENFNIVPEDLIEDLKDLKEQMFDYFKIMGINLKKIYSLVSSVNSENDPKLKRIKDDLKELISITSSLPEGKFKIDSNLIKTYNNVIKEIEDNFNSVPEDLIEDLKDLKEQMFDDDFKIMEINLKRIYSSVNSENDPKLKRIKDDLKELISITSSLSKDKIKLDSNLTEEYKKYIEDIKENFENLPEESIEDIKTQLNVTREELIKDLKDSADLMLIIYFKRIFKTFAP